MLGNEAWTVDDAPVYWGTDDFGYPIYTVGQPPSPVPNEGNMIYTRNQNGQLTSHTTFQTLGSALLSGETALRPDGSAYAVTEFSPTRGPGHFTDSGILFDGLPLNVILDNVWYVGQQEALTPYWNSGAIARPSAAILALPVAQTSAAAGSSSAESLMLFAGVGLGLYWLMKHRKA